MVEFKNEKKTIVGVEVRTVPTLELKKQPKQEAEEKTVETVEPQEKKTVVEAVKPQPKKKGGRKSVDLPTIEQKLDFVSRDKVIRERKVADFTV